MKGLSSALAIGLLSTLLVPLGVTALGSPETMLEFADPAGDLVDFEGDSVDGPAFTDIRNLRLSLDGEHLVALFELAGDLATLTEYQSVEVGLEVMIEGADSPAFSIQSSSEDDWAAWVWDVETPIPILEEESVVDPKAWVEPATAVGTAQVSGRQVRIRAPLSMLVLKEGMRFHGWARGSALDLSDLRDLASGDIDIVVADEWYDRVPDGEDEWLMSESRIVTVAPTTPPSPDPNSLTVECEPSDESFPDFDTIKTKAGNVMVEMLDLDECPWNDLFDTERLRTSLAPLGKDLGDVQLAKGGRQETVEGLIVSSWGEVSAIRVAGVPPRSLVLPLLDTFGSGHSEMADLTAERRKVDGHRVWVMTAPGWKDCYVYSVTGQTLVVWYSLGCDLGDLPASLAALGRHHDRVWRRER